MNPRGFKLKTYNLCNLNPANQRICVQYIGIVGNYCLYLSLNHSSPPNGYNRGLKGQ
jgi:hypothetical protein